jgi:hypothetical protein
LSVDCVRGTVLILPELLASPGMGLRLVMTGGDQLRGNLENSLSQRGLATASCLDALPHEEIPAVLRLLTWHSRPYRRSITRSIFAAESIQIHGVRRGGRRFGLRSDQRVVRHGENGCSSPGDLDAHGDGVRPMLRDEAAR